MSLGSHRDVSRAMFLSGGGLRSKWISLPLPVPWSLPYSLLTASFLHFRTQQCCICLGLWDITHSHVCLWLHSSPFSTVKDSCDYTGSIISFRTYFKVPFKDELISNLNFSFQRNLTCSQCFPSGLEVKKLPARQETQDSRVWAPGQEDPLE